jgi:hypothetical protein
MVVYLFTYLPAKVKPPIFFLLNVAPVRVSCITARIATLSSSVRIICASVSHVPSTQSQCRMGDVVERWKGHW